MIRFSRTALPALAALLWGASLAAAQTVPSPYRYIQKNRSLTAYVGYLNADPNVALPDSQEVELGFQPTPVVGVRYGLRVGGPLSVEAHLGFAPAQRKLHNAVVSQDSSSVVVTPTGDEVSDPLLLADAAVRFHLTGDRTYRGFAPFVLANGGVVAALGGISAEEDDIPTHRRFGFGPSLAVGVGTGLDYFVSETMSIRGELSYRLWRLRPPEGLLPARTGKPDATWSASPGVSVGAAYHF